MERKKVLLIVGAVVVFILTGTLGTYSAWGSPKWGFTYRMDNWGGARIETKRFGGEVLAYYSRMTEADDKHESAIGVNPSITYHFRGPGNTSLYAGFGYYFYESEVLDIVTFTQEVSGPTVMVGIEHFFNVFNEDFSCDIRITGQFVNWEDTYKGDGTSWKGPEGTATEVKIDLGVSVFL